jgi:hypothetical protein
VSDSSTVAPSSATVSDPGVQPVATDKPVVITDGKVPVVVTHWGWKADDSTAVVGGYVAGVVESDGTCTVTLTQGARKVTAESPARPDASTTACGALSVPGHELAPGHWRAVLSYSSPSSSGTASAVDIEVPS